MQSKKTKDRKYFGLCNEGKNGGFGTDYVNEKEFKFQEINEPTKDNNWLMIIAIIAANAFFLYMCHYIYLWGLSFQKKENLRTFIFFGSLILYLFIAFTFNNLTCFIDNTQDFSHYDQVFSNMAKDSGSVKFKIRCYHTEKSGKNTKTVTTHRASMDYYSEGVQDNSGQIKQIKQNGDKLVFVHYLKRYSFGDQETKEHFMDSYNDFAIRNLRDKKQQFNFSLDIPNYQEYVCYNNGNVKWVNYLFYAFTVIGLGAPFLLVAETMIDRYYVKIHKILTN